MVTSNTSVTISDFHISFFSFNLSPLSLGPQILGDGSQQEQSHLLRPSFRQQAPAGVANLDGLTLTPEDNLDHPNAPKTRLPISGQSGKPGRTHADAVTTCKLHTKVPGLKSNQQRSCCKVQPLRYRVSQLQNNQSNQSEYKNINNNEETKSCVALANMELEN